MTLTNCTVSGNSATGHDHDGLNYGDGGGLYNNYGTPP